MRKWILEWPSTGKQIRQSLMLCISRPGTLTSRPSMTYADSARMPRANSKSILHYNLLFSCSALCPKGVGRGKDTMHVSLITGAK